MKLNKNIMALATAAAFGISGQTFAAGTPAETEIKNTATLSYTVNSSAVPTTSSEVVFDVDTKIDLTLTYDSGAVSGNAGSSNDLTYTIKNTGNAVQFFKLTSSETNPVFKLSTDDTTITNGVLSVPVDTPISFYMGATLTDAATDGSTETFEVAAKFSDGLGNSISIPSGDKNSNLTGVNYFVLAEAITDNLLTLANGTTRDGGFAVSSDITVNAAALTGTKSVSVKTSTITDSNGDTFTTTYAIPGSTVTYTIVINSTGTNDAEGVIFSDDLATTAPELDASSISNITVLDNADSALTVVTDYTINNDGTNGNAINISLPDIPTGEKLTVAFDVNID